MFNKIDQIKNSISIVDLINMIGIKIFSGDFIYSIYKNEKNPSLKIYPQSNSFYCFSTGQGGDVIKFYSDYKKISIKETMTELSNMIHGNNIPKKIKPTFQLLNFEKEVFEERLSICLEASDISKDSALRIASKQIWDQRYEIQNLVYESLEKFCFGLDQESLDYLTGKERGLTPETIRRFRLFSIKDYKKTIEYLKDCFSSDELKLSGLFKDDKFLFGFHKIIIPFLQNGKIVYLRGRYLYEGISKPDQSSKYMGLINFSGNLTAKRFFNLDVLNGLQSMESLLITEGEFDCMIATQCNYRAIGILGVSNFPIQELNKIKDCNIYLALDNDNAGKEAAQKIVEYFKRPIKVLRLKKHKDLTELVNG